MKITVLAFTFFIAVTMARENGGIINPEKSLTIMPLTQNWSLERQTGHTTDFSEFSTAILLYYPAARNLNISLRGAQVNSGGDVENITGISDLQLASNYYLEPANTVFSLKVNFPSGQTKLTPKEFQTAALLSNSIFRFQVPTFGQGLNVSPGITWARPLNDIFVIGLGGAFQYTGSYTSLKNSDEYNPGDEILLTGGFDVRLTNTATLSGDVIFTLYGQDKLGNESVYEAGNKTVAIIRFRKYFNFHELTILTRYRSRAKNELISTQDKMKTIPDNFEAFTQYRLRLSQPFSIVAVGEVRYYEKTESELSDGLLWGIGLYPEYRINPYISIPLKFKFLSGNFSDDISLSGFELGLGLAFSY